MSLHTTGAKQGLRNMLYYYIDSLIGEGVEDPKSVIAKEIGEMINLSYDQVCYLNSSLSDSVSLSDNVDMCIKLLINLEKTQKLDLESIVIVRKTLEIINSKLNDTKLYNDLTNGLMQAEKDDNNGTTNS